MCCCVRREGGVRLYHAKTEPHEGPIGPSRAASTEQNTQSERSWLKKTLRTTSQNSFGLQVRHPLSRSMLRNNDILMTKVFAPLAANPDDQ